MKKTVAALFLMKRVVLILLSALLLLSVSACNANHIIESHASFEIDEEEVSRIGMKLADEVKASASKRGLSTEEYVLEQYGKTLQEFSGDFSVEAVKEIKRALIIGGLASRFSIDSDPAYLALAKAEYLSTVGKELEMDAALDFQFLEKSVLEYFSKPVLPLYYFWIY